MWVGTTYVCDIRKRQSQELIRRHNNPLVYLSILQLSCVLVTVPGLGRAGVKEAGLASVKRKNSVHPEDLLGEHSFVGHTEMNKTTTF